MIPLAEMFGHRKSTVLVPLVFVVPFHRVEVLAKPVRKFATSFSHVHCMTTAAGDGVNDSCRSAGVASLGVYNSFRVVDVSGSSGEFACPTSKSPAGKSSGLFLFRVQGKFVKQDVLKVRIPQVNAPDRGLTDILCSSIVR